MKETLLLLILISYNGDSWNDPAIRQRREERNQDRWQQEQRWQWQQYERQQWLNSIPYIK